MILLDDSDLYAVINYLKILGHFRINKIWVRESIKQKFFSLVKKYFRLKDLTICIWMMIEDLTPRTSSNMNIISIWSENIVLAKFIAKVLNVCILFTSYNTQYYEVFNLMSIIKIICILNYSERRCILKYAHGSLWWCHAFTLDKNI